MDENRPPECWIGTVGEFLRLLKLSGLADEGAIKELMSDFEAQPEWRSSYGHTITALIAFLVSHGVLTCWQVGKLRVGRYKGFFCECFRLLDHLYGYDGNAVYLAENSDTLELVALDFGFAPPDNVLQHRITQVFDRSSDSHSDQSPHGLSEFLDRVVSSGLVEEQVLMKLIDDAQTSAKERRWYGDTITTITTLLVSRGLLPCWQVNRLRGEGHVDFLFEGYRLLDCLDAITDQSIYLAEHTVSSELVALEIRRSDPDFAPKLRVVCDFHR